jgi:adenosylhomocysteine nucleosidase
MSGRVLLAYCFVFTEPTMRLPTSPAPIAILSALAEEQSGLLEALVDCHEVVQGGRSYWCGQLYGQPVVLALSRIGKVAAATTATALISHFGVRALLFTGVAGGLAPGVRVGDVVVADGLLQHDMDASPLFSRYEVPLLGRSVFSSDAALTQQLQRACALALDALILPGSRPAVHSGLVVSGDRFVSGTAEAATLVGNLQRAGYAPLAVEMEGAAVAQVCFDYGVPLALVRTISDRADDDAHHDFPAFVKEVASVYARAIVQFWLELLPK